MAPQEEPHIQPVAPEALPPLPEEPPEEPRLGEFARLAAVFSSPSAAFRDIARSPRWWIPVLLISAMAILTSLAFDARVGYEQAMQRVLDANSQTQNMNPVQRARAVEIMVRIAKFQGYGGAVLTTLLMVLIVAGVLKFLFDVIMGADIG